MAATRNEPAEAAEAKVLRAIVSREHKKALAERREAQAVVATPPQPPSSSHWSTKPERKRKLSAAEKSAELEAARAKEAWARRHPKKAVAERGLRKERAHLLDRFKHKNEGTPETHEHASRVNQGSLARLYQNEVIDRDQLAAAVEIATVAERIGADVTVKTASLETRVDVTRSGDGTFFEKLSQVRHEVAYTRWRSEVRGPIAAILDMVVGETVGFTIVAKRYRMGNSRTRRLLIDALDLWPRILGSVCKEIDQGHLDAARAGLS